jgi:hypothetical protein
MKMIKVQRWPRDVMAEMAGESMNERANLPQQQAKL